jgi:hypothetical protein
MKKLAKRMEMCNNSRVERYTCLECLPKKCLCDSKPPYTYAVIYNGVVAESEAKSYRRS